MIGSVLITGGLGYLGGRIAHDLAADKKCKVVIGTRRPAMKAPPWLPLAKMVQTDLGSPFALEAACRDVDAIVHLAALNHIDSAASPGLAVQVNALGTLNLLQAAERAGVKRFLYFSTAQIYRSPLVGTLTERSLPRPVHPYAITHKAAEDFVLAAHDRQALTGIVVRLSNGFGAPVHVGIDRWDPLVNDLCRQAVTERILILKSSGVQKRDLITLTDISRAVAHFLRLPLSQCDNGIFNLGGENPVRVIDAAERIASRCESMLGFRPPLYRPSPLSSEMSHDLDYRIDKLKATGFCLRSDIDGEIDATLALCQREFTGGPLSIHARNSSSPLNQLQNCK